MEAFDLVPNMFDNSASVELLFNSLCIPRKRRSVNADIVLYCIVLYCIVLYCIVLYYKNYNGFRM